MAILFFVGVDKTGKSTLFNSVLKQTNSHICVDRFTACQHIYGRLFSKESPSISELRKFESHLVKSPIPCAFIFVEADVDDIVKRFNEHNEKDIEINQISYVMEKYREYLLYTPLPVFNINTSKRTIEQCTKEIIDFANNL